MSVGMKYVRHVTKGFFLFPKSDLVWHSHVGRFLGKEGIISAGFVSFSMSGIPCCHGRSESLNIKSLEEDTQLLRKQLGVVA